MNINSFFRFFLLLLAMTSLVSLQAKDVSRYSLPKTKAETIVLECPIGKSAFVNPEDAQALGKGEILSIDYVFSSYFKGDFSQSNLDRQRIDNLHALLPKTEASELDLFRQTACSERDCASNLLHGFVITYRPGTVLSANNLEVQKFNYESTSVSNTFITEGGMSVHVPAYAFEDLHGKAVKGEIDLEVREALDDESILIAGLKTVTSKGDVLRSGGMFEVEASKDGRTLRLRKNKELTIIVPTKQLDPEMQLYTGVMDDGELSWTNPTSLNTKDIESQVDSISWDNNEIETVVSIDFEVEHPFQYGGSMEWSGKVLNNMKGHNVLQFEWDRDSLVNYMWVRIDKKRIKFTKEKYTEKMGGLLGLDNRQSKAIKKWFEMEEVLTPSMVSKVFNPSAKVAAFDTDGLWRAVQSREIAAPVEGVGIGRKRRPQVANGWMPAAGNMNIGGKKEFAYTVKVLNLGWSNIDCLARFRNTKKVSLYCDLGDKSTMEGLELMLMVPGTKICIPAYRTAKGYYSFTHGDHERSAAMPHGKKAVIFALSSEGGFKYAIKEIELGKNVMEKISLVEGDKKEALKEVASLL